MMYEVRYYNDDRTPLRIEAFSFMAEENGSVRFYDEDGDCIAHFNHVSYVRKLDDV